MNMIGLCGPCAENINKHFDCVSGATPVNAATRCSGCNAGWIDLAFVMPDKLIVGGMEGCVSVGRVCFAQDSVDTGKMLSLVSKYTDFSQEVRRAGWITGRSNALGDCHIIALDETGYRISTFVDVEPLIQWMAQFGRTKRGQDDE